MLNKYQVSWIIIEEKRSKTSKAGLKRINNNIDGYNKPFAGFSQMNNAYVRHFANKEEAQKIQKIVGGVIISDAQFGKSSKVGNIKLGEDLYVTATKKQIEDSKKI